MKTEKSIKSKRAIIKFKIDFPRKTMTRRLLNDSLKKEANCLPTLYAEKISFKMKHGIFRQ